MRQLDAGLEQTSNANQGHGDAGRSLDWPTMSLPPPNRLAGDFRKRRGQGPALIDEPRHQQPIRPFPLWLAGGRRSPDGARLETALPPKGLDCSLFTPSHPPCFLPRPPTRHDQVPLFLFFLRPSPPFSSPVVLASRSLSGTL